MACLLLPVFARPALAGIRPSLEITGSVSGIYDNSGRTLNPNIPDIAPA